MILIRFYVRKYDSEFFEFYKKRDLSFINVVPAVGDILENPDNKNSEYKVVSRKIRLSGDIDIDMVEMEFNNESS